MEKRQYLPMEGEALMACSLADGMCKEVLVFYSFKSIG